MEMEKNKNPRGEKKILRLPKPNLKKYAIFGEIMFNLGTNVLV